MLLCKLLVTLFTRILDTFMYRLNMSCQMLLSFSSIVTLITSIFDTFMFWLDMKCQITLCCKFLVTQVTDIFSFSSSDYFVYWINLNDRFCLLNFCIIFIHMRCRIPLNIQIFICNNILLYVFLIWRCLLIHFYTSWQILYLQIFGNH